MRKRHEQIESPDLGRRVHVWCYGHWGAPVVAFPTAFGAAHEWEVQGMVGALAPLIDSGKIKLYCPETNVSEAWTKKDAHPAWRASRHVAYDHFVVRTLVPFVRWDCGNPGIRIASAGASLGAFYAANVALKYPEVFHYALALSGRYEMTHFTDGFSNGDVYFNNPLAYARNLAGEPLERIRRQTHLTLVCGQGPWEEGCLEETIALADVLAEKGVSHTRDIWGHDVEHGWGWWRRQAWFHLSSAFR